MQMRIVAAIAFGLTTLAATSNGAQAEPVAKQPATRAAASTAGPARPLSKEERLISEVNRYRSRYRLRPLQADPTLMRVARQRVPFVDARRAAGGGGYNHHACGKWCRQHAREAGFPGPATDNLAMGYETPEGAVQGWASEDRDRNPAGHNYQMRGLASINGRWVDEGYNRIGVAIRGRNYIAIFGRRSPARK